jgi:hypothetical protein
VGNVKKNTLVVPPAQTKYYALVPPEAADGADVIRYEQQMLNGKCPAFDSNARFEAHLLHARALIDFYNNHGRDTDYRARDFVPTWPDGRAFSTFPDLRHLKLVLDQHLAHVTKIRLQQKYAFVLPHIVADLETLKREFVSQGGPG